MKLERKCEIISFRTELLSGYEESAGSMWNAQGLLAQGFWGRTGFVYRELPDMGTNHRYCPQVEMILAVEITPSVTCGYKLYI